MQSPAADNVNLMGGIRQDPRRARQSYSGVVEAGGLSQGAPQPRPWQRGGYAEDESDPEDYEDAGEVGELQDLGSFSLTLDPTTSRFRQGWDIMTAVLIIYIAFVLPVTMSFEPQVSSAMLTWDIVLDVIFLIDIPLNFFTGFTEDGVVVREQRKVAMHYLSGWFLVDLVSAFPFDAVILGPDVYKPRTFISTSHTDRNRLRFFKYIKVVRLLRLFRVARLSRITKRLKDKFRMKHSQVTFTGFAFFVILVAHWIACFWYMIPQLEGIDEENWVTTMILPGHMEPGGLPEKSVSYKYFICIYHAIMVMSTIGSYILPVTIVEMVYSIFAMLTGAALFAYGITNLGGIFFNVNRNDMMYHQQMDEINEFMHVKHLSPFLRKKINEYYENLYARRRFYNADEILSGLSRNLKAEVLIALHENMVLSNSFFKKMDPVFVGEVIQRLQVHSYMPGEVIMHEGAKGNEMFFIYEGTVEVALRDSQGVQKHVAYMGPGDFVGEIAIVEKDAIRTATVKAVSFCDLYSLTREMVEEVLELFPSQRERWHAVSKNRKSELTRRRARDMNLSKRRKAGPGLLQRSTTLSRRTGRILRGFGSAHHDLEHTAIPQQTKKDILESIKVRRRSQVSTQRRKSEFIRRGRPSAYLQSEGEAPNSAPGKLHRDGGQEIARGLKEELAESDRWSEPSDSPDRTTPEAGGGVVEGTNDSAVPPPRLDGDGGAGAV